VANPTLLHNLRARDERTFHELYQHYYSSMLRIATGFVRSREEAEEVIQETWLAVLAGIDRFQGRSSFKTWLFRILINRARSRARREARTVAFSALEPNPAAHDDAAAASPLPAEPCVAAPPSDCPEQHVLDREVTRLLDAAVASLPAIQRRVISLRDIEGWNADEVCSALKLTDGNQRVLLHRARMHVRRQLHPYLHADALRLAPS